ncbi:TonB-dependent receptor [Phenylobacterium sp.]|uniref:TonB-dependent receptor n=1 Tax=Phenylobacterium sp. TaxID=1871053 RepID=UPI002811271C|nr:TonB-dependent receptor [Phenylobacterium sp.]
MRTTQLFRSTALAGVMAAAFVTGAQAQDDTTGSGREIDEIVVTAQKREQSLQDVPIVVTSVSGELLRDAGVRDIRELTVLTPGLTVTSTSNETIVTARVRGVGTVGDNPGLESSVGVVIDGVYRPRNGVSFGDLGEVTRIEVLKGPQGTLFGKNTSAGVINIITAGPTEDVQAQSEVTVGDYEQFGFTSSLSGPITDGVTGRIFAAARSRNGYQDIITGPGPRGQHDDNNQNFYTVRGQLQFEPTEDITFRLIADYTKRNEDCCVGTQLFVGSDPNSRARMIEAVRPGSLDLTSTPFDRLGYANRPTDQRVEDRGVSGELTWRLTPDMALTSITAWRKWNAETGQDSDFTAADLVYRPNDGSNRVGFKQFSQELRLAGEAVDGRLNWLVGGFYAEEDLDTRSVLNYGADYYAYYAGRVLGGAPALIGLRPGTIFQQGAGSDDRYAQDGKTWALFTNNSFAITDALELTVGLRYTKDKKTLVTDYNTTGAACDQGEAAFGALLGAGLPAATVQRIVGGLCLNSQNNDFDDLGVTTQKRTEEEVTGTAKLAYRWNDDVMTYASYSRGYKAGGFNLDREQAIALTPAGTPNFTADPDTSFRGEFVDSYELGAKTSWLNNSLLLNAALFYQKYEDFQLNTFVGTAFVVETLPKVTSRGVDVDFIYLPPVEGLTFQGGVTYAETEIGEFGPADLLNPSRFSSLRRLPGAQLSFAPRWSASLATSYEREVFSGLKFRANLSGKYTSRYNTGSDLHPVKEQDAMVLVNGRVGLGAEDESWTVELWANNLFDKNYLQVGFNGPYQVDEANDAISVYNAFLGAPRTVGATLRFKY